MSELHIKCSDFMTVLPAAVDVRLQQSVWLRDVLSATLLAWLKVNMSLVSEWKVKNTTCFSSLLSKYCLKWCESALFQTCRENPEHGDFEASLTWRWRPPPRCPDVVRTRPWSGSSRKTFPGFSFQRHCAADSRLGGRLPLAGCWGDPLPGGNRWH